MKSFEQLMDLLKEKLHEKDPDLDMTEGSVCYDLLSPLAYLMYTYDEFLRDIQNKLDITKSPYEILKLWAIPRIGDLHDGEPTVIEIEGHDLNHEEWVVKRDNSYTFKKGEGGNQLISKQAGATPLYIGETMITTDDYRVTATIKKIIKYGKDKENIEQYRARYIQSLLIDSQAGLGTYYENKIAMHPEIGECGVDYPQSKGHIVTICVVNTNYEKMDAEKLREVEAYYKETEDIVPIGQELRLETADSYDISIKIQIQNPKIILEEDKVREVLEEYRKTVIVQEILRSKILTYTLQNIVLRNVLVTRLEQYATIVEIYMNNSSNDITLNRQIPKWTTITIQENRL